MRKIKFLEDFANRAKGEEWECDGMLASQLVREDKVAEFIDVESEQPETSAPKKTKKTQTTE